MQNTSQGEYSYYYHLSLYQEMVRNGPTTLVVWVAVWRRGRAQDPRGGRLESRQSYSLLDEPLSPSQALRSKLPRFTKSFTTVTTKKTCKRLSKLRFRWIKVTLYKYCLYVVVMPTYQRTDISRLFSCQYIPRATQFMFQSNIPKVPKCRKWMESKSVFRLFYTRWGTAH